MTLADSLPTNVTVLSGSTSVTATIEYDVQTDWYVFSTRPYWAYQVSVTTNTLWDSFVEVFAPDGASLLAATDSTFEAHSTVTWTNLGPAGQRYLAVGGFAQFTTGEYAMAFTAQAPLDTDGDGLPDAWELKYFGSATATNTTADDPDGDALNNGSELNAGTSPMDAASTLAITDIETGSPDTIRISWPSQQYGNYQVSTLAQPGSPWTLYALRMEPSTNGLLSEDFAADLLTNQFLRVELKY
jgi:hypothetical protein